MKRKKIWSAALCLGLMTLAGGSRLAAAEKAITPAERELQAKMTAQGWKEISYGVYERQRGANKVEHLGYGREGVVWIVGELTRQHDELLKEYQSYPSEDLHKLIDSLSLKIADGRRELRNSKSLTSVSAAITGAGCSICYSATSDSYALSGAAGQGVGAVADATFNSSCGLSGDTDAYAYARATLAGTTTTHTVDDPHTGTSVTSHATATVSGTSNCLSTTSASAISTALGISYSTSDSNSTCPPPPPTVTISSTTPVYISGTSCQTINWTASASGGTPSYSYAWTIDGTSAGTGSSASHTYCGNNTSHSQTVNVALALTDSASATASATYATTIYYTGGLGVTISGPASVVKLTGLCKSATWTSTVTGGTPYTYAWTLNGVASGTASSLTHNFCPDDIETVSVGLTVTDYSSNSGSATFSTYVDVEGSAGGCLVNCQ